MKRQIAVVLAAMLAGVSLLAQAPAGWRMRADRSIAASDPDAPGAIQFVTMGSGFHATNPRAAVYWNPANTASGIYTVKGTFTLMKPSGHTNYYGLIFGGKGLEGAEQDYLYFVVAQDGTWLIKRRNVVGSTTVLSKASEAVKKPDANGTSVNALEVRVGASAIEYVVNGAVVASTPKSGPTARTDGIYGIRVNHMLEVQIDGFAATKPS